MWNCPACNETTEDDTWETCWKCGPSRSITPAEVEKLRTEAAERQRPSKPASAATPP